MGGFEVTATKKRPQTFDSLVGQDFVVSTLKNSIDQGRIAHAYLFSGPRGVGKTSSARLLAKALNCVHGPTSSPCGECDNCKGITSGNSLDVIEIDGASNTSVNDVRIIKEEVMFPPSSSKYKIYIIDEVHMLSQSAFNALLKTIEEPPEYVIFIFATTETQKVPATVRSRCQQFNFKLIPIEIIKGLLQQAVSELGIKAQEDALYWIAGEASGSMRDAYTLFDQIVSFSDGNITMSLIREKLGLAGFEVLNDIMNAVLVNEKERALNLLRELLESGVSVENIIKEFTDYFRTLLLVKSGITNRNVLGGKVLSYPQIILKTFTEEQLEVALDLFLELFRKIKYSINPDFELELAVCRLFRLKYTYSNTKVIEQLAKLKNDLINGVVTPIDIKLEEKINLENEKLEKTDTEKVTDNIQNVLPPGVVNNFETKDGLVLEFDNQFFYNAALKDRDSILKRMSAVTKDKNVVFSFSESLEKERQLKEKKIEEEKECRLKEENKKENLVSDLIYAFDGREI